jgi:hypothetical protein
MRATGVIGCFVLACLLIPMSAGAATVSGTARVQLVGQKAEAQSGVAVTVRDHVSGESVASTTTGAAGKYSVAAPSGTFDVHFDPPVESGAGATTIENVDLSKAATVNVVLVPEGAVRFHGSIRSASEEPVPGAVLFFADGSSQVETETDSEGNFSVALAPDTYGLVIEHLNQPKLGRLLGGYWEWNLESLALEEDRSAEIVLPETSQLTVKVTGSESTPLPEAMVDIGTLSSPENLGGLGVGTLSQNGSTAQTDAEGKIHTTVFEGSSAEGLVRPPQSSGYADTPFAIPAVEGNPTLVVEAE